MDLRCDQGLWRRADSGTAAGVAGAADTPGDAINSLHADLLAGCPVEIDARNGAVVRLGRKHGIATPVNGMIVALPEAAA
ncbi:ketopantoate reductase C-terminal domain-containing protein [Roseiarcaceae bacterium H3SJ34-1]|uniref:ketopantoate reductase C-terminal domain-containing protein n=1 Tax=Terripilifer ovatus TaxID=3032367 RepID=UPI003AB9427D|nr:ketopantoate reductase C-terminal domain-containing protein [Roseiarcaceae bacterium H3SJ34-1]